MLKFKYPVLFMVHASLRVTAILVLLLMMAMAAATAVRAAQASALTITLSSAADSFVNSSVSRYAQAASEASAGRLKVQVDASAKGRSPSELLAGLNSNQLPMIEIPMQSLGLNDPLPSLDSVPFLSLNYPRAQKLWRVVRPRLAAALKAQGVRLLYAIAGSPPAMISQRPVLHTSDFRGRIILDSGEPLGRLIQVIGAQGLRVKANAVASAFKHQGIDFIFLSPSQAVKDQAWRYASHYTPVPAWFPKHLVLINEAYFQRLDKASRTMLLLTAAASEYAGWRTSEQRTTQQIQILRDHGLHIIKPSVALQLELQALGRKLLFAWSESAGDAGARLVEDYYAIR